MVVAVRLHPLLSGLRVGWLRSVMGFLCPLNGCGLDGIVLMVNVFGGAE